MLISAYHILSWHPPVSVGSERLSGSLQSPPPTHQCKMSLAWIWRDRETYQPMDPMVFPSKVSQNHPISWHVMKIPEIPPYSQYLSINVNRTVWWWTAPNTGCTVGVKELARTMGLSVDGSASSKWDKRTSHPEWSASRAVSALKKNSKSLCWMNWNQNMKTWRSTLVMLTDGEGRMIILWRLWNHDAVCPKKTGLVIEPLSLVHITIGVNESASALITHDTKSSTHWTECH